MFYIVNSPCKHACEHKCSTRRAKCSCHSGYILANDGFSCLKCATANFTSNGKNPLLPTWNVAICNNDNTSQSIICSGTLLSDQWVLTSADCVCNVDNTNNLVVSNGTCSTTEKEAGHSIIDVKCLAKYSSTVLNSNLALIKINTSTMQKDKYMITPICMANDKSKSDINIGDQVMFFGRGNIAGSIYSNATLKVSNVTVARVKECKPSFAIEGVTTFKGNTVFCTFGNTNASCNGNTGTGVVTAADNGYLLLKGVINRSTKDCGRPGSFIAHSRLNLKKVRSWIKKHTTS